MFDDTQSEDLELDFWEEFIGEQASADFLDLSVRTLQGYRQKGDGPRYFAFSARCIRYRRKDLRDWAESKARTSTSNIALALLALVLLAYAASGGASLAADTNRGEDPSPCAVHVTYLAPDGGDKANLQDPRIIIGPANGGAVRLGEPRGALAVCEGIETGHSVQQSTGIPTWTALNTSLMKNVQLPPAEQAQKIDIAADGDGPGMKAAQILTTRALSEGRTVHVVPAPDGLDWNDILKGAA